MVVLYLCNTWVFLGKKLIIILTSGASPTIHLQSGLNASGPLQSLSSTADPKLGTLCSICSSRTWKWSQSSGKFLSLLLAK